MKKLLVFVVSFFYFDTVLADKVNVKKTQTSTNKFDALLYFNRDMIINLNIAEIAVSIYTKEKNQLDKREMDSCITYTHQFDKNGNLIRDGLNRLGAYTYFKYNGENKLIDWGWEDKQTGELEPFSENYSQNDSDKFIYDLDLKLKTRIETYKNYRKPFAAQILDPCFSIEAEYEISHKDIGDIPREATAVKIRDLSERIVSHDKLYIYYNYQYH